MQAFLPLRFAFGMVDDFVGSGAELLATTSANGFQVTGFADGAEVVEFRDGGLRGCGFFGGDFSGGFETLFGELFFPFEFVAAEIAFAFLNSRLTFADGGIFLTADDGGNAVEGVEVGGLFVAGGSELEGGLFEDAEAGVGEVGLAGGGELEDLGGGFRGFGSLGEVILEGGAQEKAVEGRAGDVAVVLFFDEVDDFVVDVVVEPGGDLEELVAGELRERGVGVSIRRLNERECRERRGFLIFGDSERGGLGGLEGLRGLGRR